MESVQKAKNRLKHYPILFSKCSVEAIAYAKCVLKRDSGSIELNTCEQDFRNFQKCLRKTAQEMKIKL